ncbi:MAG TPA: enolase C-terminal domain-like protein, partial [Deinococcales bacterium]|nr:enolase C-terminal domain-like protein [Deinococcales bacterium]
RHDDIVDHAALQARLATPVCLDESLTSPESTRQALQLGSARVVNLKPGRVRGFRQSLAIHDLTRAWGVPLWCGGMLESGVGRAANLHLSSLPNFRLPGDTASSSRYWDTDLINEPLEAENGFQTIPQHGPGCGVTLNGEYLSRIQTRSAVF